MDVNIPAVGLADDPDAVAELDSLVVVVLLAVNAFVEFSAMF